MELQYAPIALFVYKRPEQTKRVIEALKENDLAGVSNLFVFSDNFRDAQDQENVNAVRAYLNEVQEAGWFHSVSIYQSEKNKGLAHSIISGVSMIIEQYGRIIVLEDDLITSSRFLRYMNECLDYFENNEKIWAVCGYTADLQALNGYDKDVYLNYRASTWGWGTWKNRWTDIDWNINDYKRFRVNPIERIRFCFGGNDTVSMLKAQMNGRIDSWGIRWCYAQSRKRKLAVAPRRSLVRNIGFDDTGTHSKTADEEKFGIKNLDDTSMSWRKDNLKINPSIVYELYRLNHLRLLTRIIDKLKEIYGTR